MLSVSTPFVIIGDKYCLGTVVNERKERILGKNEIEKEEGKEGGRKEERTGGG